MSQKLGFNSGKYDETILTMLLSDSTAPMTLKL
jgi:hypothetical protein